MITYKLYAYAHFQIPYSQIQDEVDGFPLGITPAHHQCTKIAHTHTHPHMCGLNQINRKKTGLGTIEYSNDQNKEFAQIKRQNKHTHTHKSNRTGERRK